MKAIPMLPAVLAALLIAPPCARAQEAKTAPFTPLKVQVVLSRYEGERRVASMPYTLLVNAGERDNRATLRMGVSLPIGSPDKSGTFTYHDVGTNMDCAATTTPVRWTPMPGWCPRTAFRGPRCAASRISPNAAMRGCARRSTGRPSPPNGVNPLFHTFVEQQHALGKKPMVIIAAIMRKLLHVAYGILKSQRPFDANYHSSKA